MYSLLSSLHSEVMIKHPAIGRGHVTWSICKCWALHILRTSEIITDQNDSKYKCKSRRSSVRYNGYKTHRKQRQWEQWYYFSSTLTMARCCRNDITVHHFWLFRWLLYRRYQVNLIHQCPLHWSHMQYSKKNTLHNVITQHCKIATHIRRCSKTDGKLVYWLFIYLLQRKRMILIWDWIRKWK